MKVCQSFVGRKRGACKVHISASRDGPFTAQSGAVPSAEWAALDPALNQGATRTYLNSSPLVVAENSVSPNIARQYEAPLMVENLDLR